MIYKHSKDYLIAFANDPQTKGWLKDLVVKVINSNGELDDDAIAATTNQLKANDKSILIVPESTEQSSNTDVSLISLVHHSGVCALTNEQEMFFSDDITLFYGKNGSGKSSYFRIINEIVGGNHSTSILPNIYSGKIPPINVDITYRAGETTKTLHWDGTTRSISPLNLSSVFDSSYTHSFLQKRSADTAIVLPYGLHLFSALTASMEKIRNRIQTEIDGLNTTLPNIDLSKMSETVTRVISQRAFRKEQKRWIEQRYTISEEDANNLKDKEEELRRIKVINHEDKIKIAKQEQGQIKSLHDFLFSSKSDLEKKQSEINNCLMDLKNDREANEQLRQKISVLNDIGNTDSKEWKAFVETGAVYVERSKLDEKICPYCRQPLGENALSVLQAYALFLTDTSSNKLSLGIKNKEVLSKSISSFNTSYNDSAVPIDALTSFAEKRGIVYTTRQAIDEVKLFTQVLKNSLVGENVVTHSFTVDFNKYISFLSDVLASYKQQIEDLTNELAERNKKIQNIEDAIKPLAEHKSISEQTDAFVAWFQIMESIEELQKCQKELSTRNVSTLAKTASQSLVTDNLKTKFQEELNELGLSKLNVQLCDAGASHGQTYMQLKLSTENAVTEILSEGEQKGVALALFIAERRMQRTNNPIILDDPVNSLDHFITAKLVERLSTLGNQIIIFSHNLLLLTSLKNLKGIHECGRNQIHSCTKKSKHLFLYSVNSHSRDMKGAIVEMKQDISKNVLAKAKILLDQNPFEHELEVGALLRHSIELIIDERVFNNQEPLRFHGRKDNIQWEQLKSLNPDSILIDKLNLLYNRLSSEDLHLGMERSENTIDREGLNDIYEQLKNL